ncbi:MAG: alpha-1,2-fucosyltransferase [bacterium]
MFEPEHIKHLKIKKGLILKAQEILNKVATNNKNVFVHITKGDFNNFLVFGKQSLLPMDYYHNLIRWFLDNTEKPYFIILSDEPESIKNEFDYFDNKLIVEHNYGYGVDFAIMKLCEYGILSASTFSWWGAYFMEKRKLIFYPKYWLGFHSKEEIPLWSESKLWSCC